MSPRDTTPAPDAQTDAGLDLCIRLARAHAALTRRLDSVLAGVHGLSFADFMLLQALARTPGGRLRRVDLADCLGLTASGVTRSLIPLEKTGLVSRQPDPRDARVGYATLTPAGQALLANALDSARRVADEVIDGVAASRLAEASALLGRLAGLTASGR